MLASVPRRSSTAASNNQGTLGSSLTAAFDVEVKDMGGVLAGANSNVAEKNNTTPSRSTRIITLKLEATYSL
ncbi:hypothetical protein E2C01_046426 [Portunus trituberculatus]|uniref:Uncharacterized protein n=1 Tax=Portunus trituberculatus TaxID=210409 RepID=A0A5B7G557_PORTR|nr:hypothetical protein [Portunus trituberculatus]